jgi:hypothetical protein
MDLRTLEPQNCNAGIAMRDEIDELLEDWYDWQQSYRLKLGFERVDPACRGYQSGWRESADLADIADERARKILCEAADACIQKLDLRARVAIQTEMRNRFSDGSVWSSVRLPGALNDEYLRAKRMLEPHLLACRLIDEPCKPDKSVL